MISTLRCVLTVVMILSVSMVLSCTKKSELGESQSSLPPTVESSSGNLEEDSFGNDYPAPGSEVGETSSEPEESYQEAESEEQSEESVEEEEPESDEDEGYDESYDDEY